MDGGLLGLSLEELEARQRAIHEMIREGDPLRDVTYSHCVCHPLVPLLADIGQAIEIVRRARKFAKEGQ